MKYVWINMNTGKFSMSFNEDDFNLLTKEELERASKDNWKMIKYECVNDSSFEFYNLMQIVTSKNKKL